MKRVLAVLVGASLDPTDEVPDHELP